MTKWEYLMWAEEQKLERSTLNELGGGRWELVVLKERIDGTMIMIFKRPVVDSPNGALNISANPKVSPEGSATDGPQFHPDNPAADGPQGDHASEGPNGSQALREVKHPGLGETMNQAVKELL